MKRAWVITALPLTALLFVACDSAGTPASGDLSLADIITDTLVGANSDAFQDPTLEDAADTPGSANTETGVSDVDAREAELDVLSDAVEGDTADASSEVGEISDGGPTDANEPPLGYITGECGVIAEELGRSSPSLFSAAIDFVDDPFDDPEDIRRLTSGGQMILEAGNAGGSSIYSEVFAFELLQRCDAAELLETERTIEYRPEHTGPITDFLVSIDGQRVGVSVTRAVGFPRDTPYPVERAAELLATKLSDVVESTGGVSEDDAWVKQVLLVVAYAAGHVESLRMAALEVDSAILANTVVYVVESVGDDEWLY